MSTTCDNPPYLPIGTEVSSKRREAFCESTILRIEKQIRIKFTLEEHPFGITFIINPDIPLSDMVVGKTVTISVDKKKVRAQVALVDDLSKYFVVFKDGEQTQLRRSQLVQKEERHFSAEVSSGPVKRYSGLENKTNESSTSRRVDKRSNRGAEDRDEPARKAPSPRKRQAAKNAISTIGDMKRVLNVAQSKESTYDQAGPAPPSTSNEKRDSDLTTSVGINSFQETSRSTNGGQKKKRICPFMDTIDEQYVAQTWDPLERGIQEIQRKNNSKLSFEQLYRYGYRMVFDNHGELLYNGLKYMIEYHMVVVRNRIVQSMNSGIFLDTVAESWNDHTRAMVMIRDMLMYMDRVYVRENVDLLPVYKLGLDVFQTEVLRQKGIGNRLRDDLLELIRNDRKSNQINWHGIKNACDMLISSGNDSRLVYEENFEEPLMKETSEYYRDVCKDWLVDENDAFSYLAKVETAMHDETARASRYLDKITEEKILQVMANVMVGDNINAIVYMPNGVKFMLEHKKLEDLTHIFCILKRIGNSVVEPTGGSKVLLKAVSEYVTETGTNIVKNEDLLKNPVSFVNELLQLKDYVSSLLTTAFSDDRDFKKRFRHDFESFLNSNRQSPNIVALYMDDMLRNGLKCVSDAEVENKLDNVMILFRYLQEKDVFEKYFRHHLAKRLLLDKSCSDNVEKALLAKLKTECGCQFTEKLENMFRDKELWQTLSTSFRDWKEAQPQQISFEISLRVLTAGSWPIVSCTPIVLPPEISTAYEMFTKYYTEKHTGRKLTINTLCGNAEVKATFYPPLRALGSNEESGPEPSNAVEKEREPEYKILQVNTHQMIILLQFNHRVRISCQQLMDELKIPEKELKRNLQSLALGKASQRILVRKNKRKDAIDLADEFTVNDNFQSNLTRVKVQMMTGEVETKPKIKQIRRKVEDDRKLEIESAIVRIMKARKRTNHNSLVTEVTLQLRHRFMPSLIMIKQGIETLIERVYLKRDENDQRAYQYIA